MAAKARLVSPDEALRTIEKRRTSRHVSRHSVVVKSAHGERAKAVIRDVSAYGCSLVSDTSWVRIGSFVTIVLSSERSIQAIVRWNRDGVSGVEFLRPLAHNEAEDLADD